MTSRPPVALLAALLLWGCGGAAPEPAPPAPAPATTPVAEWESLRRPRPAPAPGAPRVALGEILVSGPSAWGLPPTVSPEVAVAELVAAQLLERSDVEFVERRRFTRASERERQGLPAPAGQPPLGTSRGAELLVTGAWAVEGGTGTIELRLVDPNTSEVLHSWRVETPGEPDAVSLTRAMSGSLLAALEETGRLPGAAPSDLPAEYRASGVGAGAQGAFFRGISAEERFDWEAAKGAHQRALDEAGDGFFEAGVALARVARFRLGGTLGAGD